MKLEIACFDENSASVAACEGVDRIELCADYSRGGVSPDIELLTQLKEVFDIPVFTMIRPRGGGFMYGEEEFDEMKKTLVRFLETGADGFVFGVLTTENHIDAYRNRELIRLAEGKPCTFHRAFDRVQDKKEAMEELIALGFTTILTSGGEHPAVEGLETLEELHRQAEGRITILAGGAIRSSNVHRFKNLSFVHSACVDLATGELNREELKRLRKKVSEL